MRLRLRFIFGGLSLTTGADRKRLREYSMVLLALPQLPGSYSRLASTNDQGWSSSAGIWCHFSARASCYSNKSEADRNTQYGATGLHAAAERRSWPKRVS